MGGLSVWLTRGYSPRPALFFFFQAEDGIRDSSVTGVQTCALPISNQAGGHIWIENDRRASRLDLARAESPERPLRRGDSDRLRILEFHETAIRGVPVPLLHRLTFLGDRRDDQRVRSPGILAGESLAIGEQNLSAAGAEL